MQEIREAYWNALILKYSAAYKNYDTDKKVKKKFDSSLESLTTKLRKLDRWRIIEY